MLSPEKAPEAGQSWISLDELRGKRTYQWPRNAYLFLEDVRRRFGPFTAAETECVLNGSIQKFYNTPDDRLKIIREFAVKRMVRLPS